MPLPPSHLGRAALPQALALLFATACGARPVRPEGHSTPPHVQASIAKTPALLVLPHGGPRATWVDEDEVAELRATPSPHLAASGADAGIIEWKDGIPRYLAVDRSHGAIGAVELPVQDAIWIGLGNEDEVLCAAPNGVLYAAPLLKATTAGAFTARSRVAGAVDWDAAGAFVAATDGHRVWISKNGGASFEQRSIRGASEIVQVLVRVDGLVIVSGWAKTWISDDLGATWSVSEFQGVTRWGSWIVAREASACPAVLTRDGKTWMKQGLRVRESFHTWIDTVAISDRARNLPLPALWGTRTEMLPVPRRPQWVATDHDPCPAVVPDLPDSFPLGSTGPPGLHERLLSTAERWFGTPTIEMAFLSDGSSPRPPHVAVMDRKSGSMRIVDVPAGCRPTRLMNLSGLTLLICAEARGVRIFAATQDAQWHDEGMHSFRIWGASVGADGTILLHDGTSVDVRAPRNPGDASIWRRVDVKNAVGYRALSGGAVLALAWTDHQAQPRFSYIVDDGVSQRMIEASHSLPYRVEVLDDGRVLVVFSSVDPPLTAIGDHVLRGPSTPADARYAWLAADGTLVDDPSGRDVLQDLDVAHERAHRYTAFNPDEGPFLGP